MKCSQIDCGTEAYCRGWCRMHYERWRAHGDPTINKASKGGIRKHPMYGAWAAMVGRCHNPNHQSYRTYGARGVTVCERWRSDFRNFLADMGERPPGHSIDRIDPRGHYEPGNCRWATASEQRRNLTPDGDAHMRECAAAAQKKRWEAWRQDRTVRRGSS